MNSFELFINCFIRNFPTFTEKKLFTKIGKHTTAPQRNRLHCLV